MLTTPTKDFALTTYQSELVLVGGEEIATEEITNKLWISSDAGLNWQPSLPPMPTKRSESCAISAGTPEHLIVAGGLGANNESVDIVEIFVNKQWSTVQPLPTSCFRMCHAVHDGILYFGFKNSILYCYLSLLLANTEKFQWSQLELPFEDSSLISMGQQLVAIGGNNKKSTEIYVVVPSTSSWVHIGSLPVAMSRSTSEMLPTGELMVIGEEFSYGVSYKRAIKAALQSMIS